MEKIELIVDIHDTSHLKELIENHEVYGDSLINLIQTMSSDLKDIGGLDWKFKHVDEHFTLLIC